MPDLGIVVGEEEAMLEEKDAELDKIEDKVDKKAEKDQHHINLDYSDDYRLREGEVLDSEQVLRAVVARKCAQQNLDSHYIDMQETVKSLNMECEAALSRVKNRKESNKRYEKMKEEEEEVEVKLVKGGRSVLEDGKTIFTGTELSRVDAQKSEVKHFLRTAKYVLMKREASYLICARRLCSAVPR